MAMAMTMLLLLLSVKKKKIGHGWGHLLEEGFLDLVGLCSLISFFVVLNY